MVQKLKGLKKLTLMAFATIFAVCLALLCACNLNSDHTVTWEYTCAEVEIVDGEIETDDDGNKTTTVAHNGVIKFSVTPTEDYAIKGVYLNGEPIVSENGYYSVTVTKNSTIQIKTNENDRAITWRYEHCTVSVENYATLPDVCELGEVLRFTVTCDSGYSVKYISTNHGTLVETNGYYEMTVTDDTKITITTQKAEFSVEWQYENCTVVMADGSELPDAFERDGILKIKVIPDSGYSVTSVVGNYLQVSEKNGYYEIKVTSDTVVKITTSVTTYQIEWDFSNCFVKCGDSGRPTSASFGRVVKFTVSPYSGYLVTAVKVNGTELTAVNGEYSFTVNGKCTVNIICEQSLGDYCDVTWIYNSAHLYPTVNGSASLPTQLREGETLEFQIYYYSGVSYSVYVNDVSLQGDYYDNYSVVITGDTEIEIKSEKLEVAVKEVSLQVIEGVPYYTMYVTYSGYAPSQLEGLYFDFQNYADYNGTTDKSWNREELGYTYEQVEGKNAFYARVDISYFEEGRAYIPHFNGSDGVGDIKVDTVDIVSPATAVVDGKLYVIDAATTPWNVAAVYVTGVEGNIVVEASDTTACTFNEIVLHNYFTDETLPVIEITTKDGIALDDPSLIIPDEHKGTNGELPVYDYAKANIKVTSNSGDTETDEKYTFETTDNKDKVKIRGNYTSTYPKRPIRIKFDKKHAMLGLNDGAKLKNWVLLNDYKDSSLLRNSVAAYLGNTLLESDGYYATDFRYVEVYVNGDYRGVYLLVEQQEVKEDRVNIPEATDPEDYFEENPTATEAEIEEACNKTDIGYFVEFDGYYFNEKASETFTLNYNYSQKGYTISSDVYYEEQRAFIAKVTQNIWDIVYDATRNTTGGLRKTPFYTLNANGDKVQDESIKTVREAVERVIDIKSLVDVFILNEICCDADLGWSSFMFSIDMSASGNKKMTFQAPWDFDSALGNKPNYRYDTSFISNKSSNPWLDVLFNEDWFWSCVNAKWDAMEEAGAFTGAIALIDSFTALYEDYYAKNYEKWPECLGSMEDSIAVSNQAESAEILKEWLTTRINNLSSEIDKKVK